LESWNYIVFADHRFAKEADEELQKLFPAAHIGERAARDGQFFMARMDGDKKGILSAIKAGRPSFVDAVIPIDAELGGADKDYGNVIRSMAGLLDKRSTFKIEVKRMDPTLRERAKSIEVRLGSALEAEGFRADLKNPKTVAYVILMAGKTLIGTIGREQVENYVLDRFRLGQKETGKVNRAEFKLEEAVEFFGVDLSKVRRALDIGAAPGGWTHYLATHRVRVVAIDNALLDYEKLCQAGKLLVVADRKELSPIENMLRDCGAAFADIDDARIRFDGYAVIHIKMNLKSVKKELLDRLGEFGLLTIDTNTEASTSAGIADSLACMLDPDAHLIMTVKLVRSNTAKQVAAAEAGISGSYDRPEIKKLPHNRDELTLHARKRSRSNKNA
jgi:23S rRNA U2552 (ribose-2'-O)-methylase RlmE/FtsJ